MDITDICREYQTALSSPDNPANEPTPKDLSEQELKTWAEDHNKRVRAYEDQKAGEVADALGITPQEVHDAYRAYLDQHGRPCDPLRSADNP